MNRNMQAMWKSTSEGLKFGAARHSLRTSAQLQYPAAARLPLPLNIDPNEMSHFSQARARDINASFLQSHPGGRIDVTFDRSAFKSSSDPRMDVYDRNSAVRLNSSMQSNVPEPFGAGGLQKFPSESTFTSHCISLNMPGGQWGQGQKYTSSDLNASHYTNLRREFRRDWDSPAYTTVKEGVPPTVAAEPPKSRKEQLKRAIKDYGATVLVFHVGISLASLGGFYALVSSGIDVPALLDRVGIQTPGSIAAGASTFVLAYAIHKLFAPVRITITLGATPFIVRYLRAKGILKPPKGAVEAAEAAAKK